MTMVHVPLEVRDETFKLACDLPEGLTLPQGFKLRLGFGARFMGEGAVTPELQRAVSDAAFVAFENLLKNPKKKWFQR